MPKAKTEAAAATPHTEEFTITRRPGWGAALTVTIECNPLDFSWVKLGLAVRVAHERGARLVGARLDGARLDGARLDGARLDGARLDGASLVGARLDGARLDGASLVGARLDGASLVGARLDGARLDGARLDGASLDGALVRGDKVARLIACAARQNDAYVFYAFELQGGGVKILAGCRWFTVAEYRDHVASEYSLDDKGHETSDILDYFEARCRHLGVALEPATATPEAA